MTELSKEQIQNKIAARVAQELKDGDLVNLGIGLPTLVANFIPEGMDITLQSENGFIGLGPADGSDNQLVVNAGGRPVTIQTGGAFFDSATSFGIIRGGHVNMTVLGALEVDQAGNIASYMIPGKMVPGMGGAMDLVVGANTVIVAMQHTNRGEKKLLKQCTLPLTAKEQVDLIITELGVFKPVGNGYKVIELSDGYSLEDVQAVTEGQLIP